MKNPLATMDPDYLMGDIPFGVCLLDGDFEILDANEKWLEITSAEKGEIIGKKLSEVFPEIKKNLTDFLAEIIGRKKPFHVHEFPISFGKDALAVIRNYNFIYYPVFNSNDEPEHFCSIAIEIPDTLALKNQLAKSEERLRLATESNNICTWDLNLKTLEVFHSESLAVIMGYEDGRRISHTEMINHLLEEDRELMNIALEKAIEEGSYNFEGRIQDSKGEIKWINSRGKIFYDADKNPERILGILQDITETKNLTKEIEDREVRYKFLADAMPQFIWISDADGELNYWNQAVFDYSGKNYNELLAGEGWSQIVHPEDRSRNVSSWAHSIDNKTIFSIEHRFQNANGDYKWFLSRAVPDLDDKGNVKHWVGTSTDIDEIKKLEHQKNDFIKMANHELKTPVTTIKGYIQLLKKMRGNSDDLFLNTSLNTIEKQVNKLNNLIGDLLDISRMEIGNLPLVKHSFSLIKLVTETIEDIKASENTHEIKFVLNCKTDVEVNGDKERITQVLNNLLTNAIKYSPTSRSVTVDLSINKNTAVVSVEDSGIGMDKGELQKIFQRFYRVSGEDEATFPGFGIGLFIVKDILTRHKGKIWVESEKNKGSKFYFSLPLNQTKL